MQDTPSESKSGCILGGCGVLGCSLLIVVPLVLLGTAWFILFHTPIPFNWFAKALNKDENIEVGKISGSISKGFRIAKIEFSETPGEVSILEDVRILYPDLLKSLSNNEFNIQEIGVARARLYVDSVIDIDETEDLELPADPSPPAKETSAESARPSMDELEAGTLARFHIGKVDIRNVELLDPSNNFQFHLDECTLDGFEIVGKCLSMGQLTIRSSVLDFSFAPLQTDESGAALDSELKLQAALQPNESLKVRKTITLDGTLDLADIDHPRGQLSAFDGKLRIRSSDKPGHQRIEVTEFTPADYLDIDLILPTNLKWDATVVDDEDGNDHIETHTGSFTLGGTGFEISTGKHASVRQLIVATSTEDQGNYTLTLEEVADSDEPRIRLRSKLDPDQADREILAGLTFGKPFAELDAADQKRVRKTLGEPMPPKTN